MSVKNLLTLEEQSFTSSTGLWRPLPATANAFISRSVTRYNSEPASMIVTSLDTNRTDVELDREVRLLPNTQYRISYSAFSESSEHPFGIECRLYTSSGTLLGLLPTATENTVLGRWKLVSVEFTSPSTVQTAQIRAFSYPSHTDQIGNVITHPVIWMDDFVFVESTEYPENDFALLAQRHIPEYMLEIDDEEPGKPLRRFLDVMTSTADEVLQATRAFDYIPAVDGVTGYERSSLVDPSYYPDETIARKEWLPWLAQTVGARGIVSGSNGQTPWFWLENEIETWNALETQIDPSSNAVWSITTPLMQRTSGVVTATLLTQIGGATPYFPAIGDVVEVTGNNSQFSGSFSIVSSNSGTKVLTWNQSGSNATDSSGSASQLRISDASWQEVEQANPLAFDTTGVLVSLVRTGATGLKAGSRYAIKAAARSVLDGYDRSSVMVSRNDGKLEVTTSVAHSFVAGDFVEVYDCPEDGYNKTYTVLSVVSSSKFLLQSPYVANLSVSYVGDPNIGGEYSCWVTNKEVILTMTNQWEGTIQTEEGQTYAVGLLEKAISMAKPAGLVLQHGYTT